LTKTKIIFQAHKFNVGGTANKLDLNLNQLIRVQIKGLNEIEIFDRYNKNYVFVVNDRKTWTQLIEDAIIKNRGNDILTEGGEVLVSAAKKALDDTPVISKENDTDLLLKLKKLKDDGILTETEYNEKKQNILNRM